MNYYEEPLLSGLYLEDSYVLSINEGVSTLVFELEAVLTEKHSKYEKPQENEYYCYRRVSLSFLDVVSLEWLDRGFLVFSDSSGESDYGNIDKFNVGDGWYALSGDWGAVVIRGGNIKVVVAD